MIPDSFVDFVVFLDGIYGDGNVSSTASDLLKWDQALRAGKLISKESMNEIYAPTILPDKTSTNYGYGWFVKSEKEKGVSVYHGGGFPGYKTYIERQLDSNKTLIALGNSDDTSIPAYNIFEILSDKQVTKMYRKQIEVNADIVATYAGMYRDRSDEKMVINLSALKNALIFNSSKHQNWNLRLFPERANYFFSKVTNIQIEFSRSDAGETGLKLYQDGKLVSEAVRD